MSDESLQDAARKRLGFTEAVAEYIAPVLLPYGYACTLSSVYSVDFESQTVCLRVMHDRLSYEMEIYLSLKTGNEREISLGALIESEVGPQPNPGIYFQSSSRSGISSSIRQMAALLARFGRAVLEGEPGAYTSVEVSQSKLGALRTEHFIVDPIRRNAEDAWRRKDFKVVSELYQSIEAKLSPTEKKRLRYARKHA
jgi:hypothetical protein